MKKITIEIETKEGRATVRDAIDLYPFAVHVAHAYRDASASHARDWSVTHVPSGMCVGQRFTFREACALARLFRRDRFWLTADPKSWDADARFAAKGKRDWAFAQLGLS